MILSLIRLLRGRLLPARREKDTIWNGFDALFPFSP